jgi:hypothetical protein
MEKKGEMKIRSWEGTPPPPNLSPALLLLPTPHPHSASTRLELPEGKECWQNWEVRDL